MKFVSLTAALFACSTAFACPDLSGTYTCHIGDTESELVVSQVENKGITVYTMKDSTGSWDLITDGNERTSRNEIEDHEYTEETNTVTCLGNAVNINYHIIGTWDGTEVQIGSGTTEFSLDSNKNFSIKNVDIRSSSTNICPRK